MKKVTLTWKVQTAFVFSPTLKPRRDLDTSVQFNFLRCKKSDPFNSEVHFRFSSKQVVVVVAVAAVVVDDNVFQRRRHLVQVSIIRLFVILFSIKKSQIKISVSKRNGQLMTQELNWAINDKKEANGSKLVFPLVQDVMRLLGRISATGTFCRD